MGVGGVAAPVRLAFFLLAAGKRGVGRVQATSDTTVPIPSRCVGGSKSTAAFASETRALVAPVAQLVQRRRRREGGVPINSRGRGKGWWGESLFYFWVYIFSEGFFFVLLCVLPWRRLIQFGDDGGLLAVTTKVFSYLPIRWPTSSSPALLLIILVAVAAVPPV